MVREAVYKITENCPCNCAFCDSREKYLNILKKQELDLNNWKKITDKLLADGLEVAVLSGGEPLLRPNVTFPLVDYLHANNIYVVLNSSGILFEHNDNLFNELFKHFPDLLVFSVDSISSEKHDLNRAMKGTFHSVVNSIKKIKEHGNFYVGIRTVITRNNYREIPDIISYFSRLGVDCIKLTNIENDMEKRFILTKNELDEFNNEVKPKIYEVLRKCDYETEEMLEDNILKISKLLSNTNPDYLSIANGIFSPNLVGNAKCDLNGRFFAIQSNGDVLPCCEAEHHYEPLLGNILKDDVEDIYKSSEYITFSNNRPKYCKTCTQRHNLQLNFKSSARKVERR
mgnify:FL=1